LEKKLRVAASDEKDKSKSQALNFRPFKARAATISAIFCLLFFSVNIFPDKQSI
jgi:hypothetical protein